MFVPILGGGYQRFKHVSFAIPLSLLKPSRFAVNDRLYPLDSTHSPSTSSTLAIPSALL